MLKVVHDAEASNENAAGASLLDEIVRDGARAMLATALQAEVAAYVEAHADQLDEHGHRLVVRNGHHQARQVSTAAGAVSVRATILTDALQQLGDYGSARTELQTMLDLQPGVPAFTRASYTWELEGRLEPARSVLRQALDAATRPSDQAYCLLYLGELAWNQGRLAEADRFYRQGLRQDPTYTALLAGRAKIAAARGDVGTAVALYEEVVRRLPAPTYLIAYADLLRSLGRDDEAARQEAVIEATRTLFEEQGVDVDLEFALYDADRGRGGSALRAARAVWERQRSVDAADAYAWALHVVGRDAQAFRLAERAERLGTRSALFSFHRGMIERDLGRTSAARASLERALELNPSFSPLLAPRAEAALADLGTR